MPGPANRTSAKSTLGGVAIDSSTIRLRSPRRRRFSAEDYALMAKAGVLKADERTELIQGEVLTMSPIGVRRAFVVDRLTKFLSEALAGRAHLRVQGPIRLGKHSEPVPDLAILKPSADDYASRHPGPLDVLFLIEVMDATAVFDRGDKRRLYARPGIPELWLVDVNEEWIEVHLRPRKREYLEMRTFERGETLASVAFPDVRLEVDRILG